ncbi:hypothetical protein KC345_g920 [Hortaea werneckii]|nr:hypothetical protein KC345_g920 [Hortaea werneckii]
MSTLYPKYNVGFRLGLFTGMYSVAGAFAGVLAYGLLKLDTDSLHGWQTLFLVEGDITVALGLISFFVLPSSLSSAWFLTAEERVHAVRRMELDLAGAYEGKIDERKVSRQNFIDVAKDWKKLLIVLCNITAVLPGIKANLMSVPPFVVGTVGLLIIVWLSDCFKERSIHTVCGMSLGIVGCIVMATSIDTQLRYGFAHVCMAGVFAGGPLLAVWLAGNTPDKNTRSVIMGVNGWSNIAGVIAGQIFKSRYAPRYEIPLIVTMCLMAFGMCGLMFVKTMYIRENKLRGRVIEQQFATEATSPERRGDQKRTFMYGT